MAEVLRTVPLTPSLNLRGDLLECLSHLEPTDWTKAFALFETQKNPPNPGLCLKNGGQIGLPLSDGDAKVFKAATQPSPLKKVPGASAVDAVWLIPAREFEIQNPAWEPFLQGILTKVSAGLGVNSTGKGVSAELVSLSLQDQDLQCMEGQR